jgi:quercetin dioxygenase-like cupin family protein
MIIKHYEDVPAVPVAMEGAEDVLIREVVTARDGAPTFAMRIFDVRPGGHTPLHDHEYEHEVFVIEGEGEVAEGKRISSLHGGSVVFIRPGTPHQFRNTGAGVLRFICMIPIKGPAAPPPQDEDA